MRRFYWIDNDYSYIFRQEKIKNPQGYILNLAAQKIKDRFDNQANPFVLIINGKTECPYKNVCLSKNELSFAIGCFSKGYSKEWNLHDDYNSCTKSANGLVLTNSKHSEKEPIFIEFCTKQMVQKCKEDSCYERGNNDRNYQGLLCAFFRDGGNELKNVDYENHTSTYGGGSYSYSDNKDIEGVRACREQGRSTTKVQQANHCYYFTIWYC